MLSLYRRHAADCPHKQKGRQWKRCKCPIWADGSVHGRELRYSMKTRVWAKAEEALRGQQHPEQKSDEKPGATLVEDAVRAYTQAGQARGLAKGTQRKHRVLLQHFQDYCAGAGLRYLHEITPGHANAFRESWADAPLSASKKLERFRAFFRFCMAMQWTATNPATAVLRPICKTVPTLPYTREEVQRLLDACDGYKHLERERDAERLRVWLLVLRYTGMRATDATKLRVDQVSERAVLVSAMQKTGEPVWCPIPAFVVEALASCPRTSEHYYFWSGNGDPESQAANWRRALSRLAGWAKVENVRAHRFRDTFSVELLVAGVPLEDVSRLLGHTSIRITEKHYAPWVRSRQERLEASVQRALGEDPLALRFEDGYKKGTPTINVVQ